MSEEQALDETVAALATGCGGVPFRCTTCIAIGPGGAGKTSARRAIQGYRATTDRISTVGGERDSLAVVQLRHGAAMAFSTASQLNLTHVQRGLVECIERVRAGLAANNGSDKADGGLRDHVDVVDAFTRADNLRLKHAEQEAVLTAFRAELESSHKNTAATAAVIAAIPPQETAPTRKPTPSLVPPPTKPRRTSIATPKLAVATAPGQVSLPEQIHAEQGVVLSALAERWDMDVNEIVRVIFYDMGGQPEFWPLVGEFIRRCVAVQE